MLIKVGTGNKVKVQAVRDVLKEYPSVISPDFWTRLARVQSGVEEQPLSLEETSQGAYNRAKAAFVDCDLSVGIESGLMDIPSGDWVSWKVTASPSGSGASAK